MDTMRERVAKELARERANWTDEDWRKATDFAKGLYWEQADAIMAIVAEDREKLVAALGWAMHRLTPYTHASICTPTLCSCGYDKARAALASVGK